MRVDSLSEVGGETPAPGGGYGGEGHVGGVVGGARWYSWLRLCFTTTIRYCYLR